MSSALRPSRSGRELQRLLISSRVSTRSGAVRRPLRRSRRSSRECSTASVRLSPVCVATSRASFSVAECLMLSAIDVSPLAGIYHYWWNPPSLRLFTSSSGTHPWESPPAAARSGRAAHCPSRRSLSGFSLAARHAGTMGGEDGDPDDGEDGHPLRRGAARRDAEHQALRPARGVGTIASQLDVHPNAGRRALHRDRGTLSRPPPYCGLPHTAIR